jgi:hypothetical protein
MTQYDGQAGKQPQNTATPKANNCPILIKQQIEEKRRLRRN